MLAALAPVVSTSSKLGFQLLTALVLIPAAGALIALLVPANRPDTARAVGYAVSTGVLAMALFLLTQFDTGPGKGGYQLVEDHSWIGSLGISWKLGVDGISLFMVVLTALLFPIGLLASARIGQAKQFTVWMLFLEAALIGAFLAADALVFFIFFEFMLVPMYFLIAEWGHGNRRYAAMKFFLFTMAGSAFLFVGILSVAFLQAQGAAGTHHLTFDIPTLTTYASDHIGGATARWLFVAFAIGFAVKVPLFPFHTWLPDAHTDAPTAGSVVLAGVMLKIGTYGFLRFAIPFFPRAAVDLAPLLLVVAVIGITYGAIVAAMQPNLKRIIAYSSVAHLGFVVLGTFALTKQGISGGLFTMVSHGLTTGALFLLVGMLYDRRHTYELSDYRGLWKAVPIFGGLFVATTFASIGLPGFSGFVGEFLALLGAFLTSRWYVVVATSGVILAAVYLLWAVQRAFTGEPDDVNRETREIGAREFLTVAPLLALSLFLGFYPKPVLDRFEPSVDALVQHVQAHNPGFHIPAVSDVGPAGAKVTSCRVGTNVVGYTSTGTPQTNCPPEHK
jgi:NADH-quinone oxidoreductase subunit M